MALTKGRGFQLACLWNCVANIRICLGCRFIIFLSLQRRLSSPINCLLSSYMPGSPFTSGSREFERFLFELGWSYGGRARTAFVPVVAVSLDWLLFALAPSQDLLPTPYFAAVFAGALLAIPDCRCDNYDSVNGKIQLEMVCRAKSNATDLCFAVALNT